MNTNSTTQATPAGPFRSLDALFAASDGRPDWVCPGISAIGAITQFSGKTKEGKTVFTGVLVRAGLTGEPFLGMSVEFDRVIYMSEQSPSTLASQLQSVRIGPELEQRIDFVLLWDEKVRKMTWPDRAGMVTAHIKQNLQGLRVLVVVDTIVNWAGMRHDDENKQGPWAAAYAPLHEMKALGNVAIFVNRQSKKTATGDPQGAGRGHSAGDGEADILLALSKPEGRPGIGGTQRVLRGIGRYDDEIEDTIFIEWHRRDGTYVRTDEEDKTVVGSAGKRILQVLGAEPMGKTVESIQSALNDLVKAEGLDLVFSRTVTDRALSMLVAAGSVRKTGTGFKGDPKRYTVAIPATVGSASQVPGE